jgi:hypothetical protein
VVQSDYDLPTRNPVQQPMIKPNGKPTKNAVKVANTHKHFEIHWILKTGQCRCSTIVSKDIILQSSSCLPPHEQRPPIFQLIILCNHI